MRTPSLILRHLVPGDAPKVFAMSRERGMREWLPDQVYGSEKAARELLEYLISCCDHPGNPRQEPYVLGVCLKETGELIGHVGLSPLEGQVEVGYAIEDRHQGRGYAKQAVKAASEWGLAAFGLTEILGIVAADNVASCRVLEAAGYALINEVEGVLHGRNDVIRSYRIIPVPPA